MTAARRPRRLGADMPDGPGGTASPLTGRWSQSSPAPIEQTRPPCPAALLTLALAQS